MDQQLYSKRVVRPSRSQEGEARLKRSQRLQTCPGH